MSYGGSYGAPLFSWSGKGGFAVAFMAFVALTLLQGSVGMDGTATLTGHGLCFPAPETWEIGGLLSLWINIVVIISAAVFSIFFTKHFNFVPPENLLYAIGMLLMCAATPMVTERLNSGVLMLVVLLICLYRLFSLYGRRNCADGIFVVFSLLSLGSMIQYGFLLLIPVLVLGAAFMREMNFRSFVAMILGVVAPYWIVLTTGIIRFSDLTLPSLTNLFHGAESPFEIFRMILTVGISAVLLLLALLANAMRTGSEGVMQRSRRSLMHLTGFALLWFMVFDFTNMLTYMPAFFMMTGYECSFWAMRMKIPQRNFLALLMFVIYVSLGVVFEFV